MSDDIDARGLEEAFLRANANAGYIGSQLANLVRHILRLAVNGNTGMTLYNASDSLQTVLQLAQRAQAGVTFHDVVQAAVEDVMQAKPCGAVEEVGIDLAKDGIRYFLEMSSPDGFGRARASKRLDSLLRAARELDEDIRLKGEFEERRRYSNSPKSNSIAERAEEMRFKKKDRRPKL